MKNYYEVLEISSNASQEVIDRVYKLLAKKYHPDLNPDNKEEAAEKFKEISEAYETLSDEYKRKKHDEELAEEQKRVELEKEEEIINKAQEQIQYIPQKNIKPIRQVEVTNNIQTNNNKIREEYQEAMNKAAEEEYYRQLQEYNVKKAYNDAYVDALRSMGVRVVYKKTFKDYLRIFITFIIIVLILIVLWQIPIIREKVFELYEQLGPLKNIIDMLIKAISKNN